MKSSDPGHHGLSAATCSFVAPNSSSMAPIVAGYRLKNENNQHNAQQDRYHH
jgi:hypothetical protein